MPAAVWDGPFREVLAGADKLADVVDECLRSGKAIVRRTVSMDRVGRASHLGVTVSPIREEGGGTHVPSASSRISPSHGARRAAAAQG